MTPNRKSVEVVISVGIAIAMANIVTSGGPASSFAGPPVVPAASVETPTVTPAVSDNDAMALARLGQERYKRDIRGYSCVFHKQELIDGKLTPVQEIEVRYREQPHSVYMIWRKNADKAKRALYINHSSFVDGKGQPAAKVEPAGAVARLFVSEIMMAIRGPEAKAASRRAIDEFGFKSTLDLLVRYNAIAEKNGELDFRIVGEGSVDGRPTHVLVRTLPYTGPNSDYPDARMVLQLDKEWLLPVAVHSYADAAGKQLLGSYVMTQVVLNPNWGNDAFRF